MKAIAVEPDGSRVVTGAFDYAMMVWLLDSSNTSPPKPIRLADHDGAVNAVAIVPDAHSSSRDVSNRSLFLAAGDDGRLTVWRTSGTDGTIDHRFSGHSAKVVAIAVATRAHAETRVATASWDRTARLWNLSTRTAGPVLSGHGGPVNGVAFSGDGQYVYTASVDGHLRKFRVDNGQLERSIYSHAWGLTALQRLPGHDADHLLIGSLNGSVIVVDGGSGEVIRELPAHDRPVLALASIEKPDLIATGGGDGIIRVMRARDGAVLETYHHPSGPIWALAFTPDGTGLYHGGLDDFASLWRFAPRAPFEAVDAEVLPRRFQISPKAAADATPRERQLAEGERQFARKCSVCHTLTPQDANRAGPTLYGVFGRRIATMGGYPYSAPLKTLDIVWDETTIARLFELGPDKFTPGSKMPLQIMSDKSERDALIAYLKEATRAN